MPRAAGACLRSLCSRPALAQSPKVGDPPEAHNMRLVGMNDLQARSAYQPTIHRQGDRYIAYIGHHGGTPDVPKPVNKMTGQAEFNGTSILDVTDPANPKYLKHMPGLEGNYEEGGAQMVRVCDGASLPRGDKPRPTCCACSAGRRMRSGTSPTRQNPALHHAARKRARHAQELVGVRHRHRLPRLRHSGLARAAHDADLRPLRSRQADAHPRLRHRRPGAGLDRHRDPDRTARRHLDRAAEQPRLFRLRHQQGRRAADRRPREAAQRAEGADAGQSARAGDRRIADVAAGRRAHGVPARQDRDPGVRQGQGRRRARHGDDRRRVAGERMPGGRVAPDGVVRRRDDREIPDGGVELHAGGEGISASAAGASARIRRTRAWRRCSTASSPS